MPHTPKFKLNDKVLFKQKPWYIVEIERLENTYYYAVAEKPGDTAIISMIPESELS
jgi:hypothetical protein